MADNVDNILGLKIIDAKTIAASGSFTTQPIAVSARKLLGNITVQLTLTGTGTAKLEFEQSNNFDPNTQAGDWVKPVSGFGIVTGFTVTSGTGTNGKDLMNLACGNSQFLRIVATETGGANPVVLNAWVSMQ